MTDEEILAALAAERKRLIIESSLNLPVCNLLKQAADRLEKLAAVLEAAEAIDRLSWEHSAWPGVHAQEEATDAIVELRDAIQRARQP